jgi:hypothetical protein
MQIRRSHLTVAVVLLLLVSATVFVQRQLARDSDRDDTTQTKQSPVKSDTTRAQQMLLKDPDGPEFERTMVVNSPFSATLIIETSIQLPDGTLLTKTRTSLIYRDGKGRTRRDWLPEPVSSASVGPTRSVINDPVAGFTYTLDHKASSAARNVLARLPVRSPAPIETASKKASGRNQILPMPSTFETGKTALRTDTTSDAAPKTPEALGTREIEGVLAEGTRLSFTVPAGTIGNDIPLETAAERWHAPALQTVVLLKRTVGRYGETTYRLTDINRGEPAAALFSVPANYEIHDDTEVSHSRKTP